MKKITKRILTVVLALTMVLGMTTMVSATQADTGLIPEEGYLTKTLLLPDGAEVPTKEFFFDFTAVSVDGRTDATSLGTMPVLSAKMAFAPGDTVVPNAGGLESATKITNNFTATKADGTAFTFPHAGEYIYTVIERQQPAPGNPGHDSNYTYSEAQYQVTVFVTTPVDGDGNPTGGALTIDSVGFRAMVNDAGTGVTGLPKTDPVFINRFEPPTTFEVSKQVRGTYADTTFKFDYTLAMTRPTGTHTGLDSYTGVIFNADGTVADAPNTVVVTFAANQTVATPVTFKLSDGQYLRFEGGKVSGDAGFDEGMTGLPTGVTYTLTEAATRDYIAQANVFVNTADLTTGSVNKANTAVNTALVIGGTPGTVLTTPIVLGEKENQADFINTHQSITPTGILLNNLPFIILIVLALGGLTLYIVGKRRKAVK